MQQLRVLYEKRDDGLRRGVVLGAQAKLCEHRVLANEVGDGIFELVDDRLQRRRIRLGFEVLDDIELDVELTRDGESVRTGISIAVVEDRDVGHGCDITALARIPTECAICGGVLAKPLSGDLRFAVMSATGMDPICDDLAAETADLVAILRSMSEPDWDQATPAEDWAVRDQVSHLAFFDETGTLAATDEDAFRASSKALMTATDPGAAGLTSGRAMTGADLLAWFERVRSEMIRVFRTLDPKARLPWYGPAMGARSFATARLMETWAHGQDVVDTVGAKREPTARLKHVAHIGVGARPFSYMTNRRTMPEGDVGVRLHAPDGSLWTWNDAAAVDNVVEGDALEFCLVVTQRRNIADTGLIVRGPLAEDWIPIAQAFAGAPGSGRTKGQFD